MPWHDESWEDGYDAWKTQSPDDEFDDECFHEEYEADFNGRATCYQCGHVWYLSSDEIEAERRRVKAYDEMMRREERREMVERIIDRLAFWRRWRKAPPIVDDIPF